MGWKAGWGREEASSDRTSWAQAGGRCGEWGRFVDGIRIMITIGIRKRGGVGNCSGEVVGWGAGDGGEVLVH